MQKSKLNEKILAHLANHLGIDVQDIDTEDSFSEDLHMSLVDLSDFAHVLENLGYKINPEQISDFETVGELVEFLAAEEGV